MRGTLGAVLAVAVLGGLLLPAVGGVYADQQTAVETENATVTVDYNNSTTVPSEPYDLVYDNETVTANSTTLTEGTDYDYDNASRELAFTDTTATSSGDDATIEYAYRVEARSQTTTALAGVLTALQSFVWVLALAAAGGVVLAHLYSGGGGF